MRKFVLFAAAAMLVVASTSAGTAGSASRFSPGHQMQTRGSVHGSPGASGYAPGHMMQRSGSVRGHPGASGWAPGHRSTTGMAPRR